MDGSPRSRQASRQAALETGHARVLDPVVKASAGRVIAGVAKGTRLAAPGQGTRPLGDRVKETLFAILEAQTLAPWPAPFLDLFAGSGAAGIEALSRGSPRVVFVERDSDAVRVIRENLERARLGGGSHAPGERRDSARAAESIGANESAVDVVQSDVLRFLAAGATARGRAFGAVLVDPPYGDAAMLAALERLRPGEDGWIAEDAVVVAKHFWRDQLPLTVGALERRRERRFGETMLSFYVPVAKR